MNDGDELANNHELIAEAEKWARILREEGASGVFSSFPKGDFEIGGVKIRRTLDYKQDQGEPMGYSIQTAQTLQTILPNPSEEFWLEVINAIQQRNDGLNSWAPKDQDVIAIADLYELSDKWPEAVRRGMMGIINKTRMADGYPDSVHHVMIIPKEHLNDLTKAIVRLPQTLRQTTGIILAGIDQVVPRQTAHSTHLRVCVRKDPHLGSILQTQYAKELPYK